jgi:hypothetical protein
MDIESKNREHQIYYFKDAVLLAVFEDGGVVFDSRSRRCHEINEIGAQILKLLDGRRNIKEVVYEVSAKFGEPEERVRKDLVLFLAEIIGKGWLDVRQR